MSVIVC